MVEVDEIVGEAAKVPVSLYLLYFLNACTTAFPDTAYGNLPLTLLLLWRSRGLVESRLENATRNDCALLCVRVFTLVFQTAVLV